MPLVPFSLRLLARYGWTLYWKNFKRLFGLALSFFAVAKLLDVLEYYGLFGVFRCPASACGRFDLEKFRYDFPDLRTVSYPGPIGPVAGVLGVFSMAVAILGVLAIIRALSLAYHHHASTFTENVRFGSSRFWSFNMYLLRAFFHVTFAPLLAALVVGTLFLVATSVFPSLFEGAIVEKILTGGLFAALIVFVAFITYRNVEVSYGALILVDQGLPSKESLDESRRITKGFWWVTFLFPLVLALLALLPVTLAEDGLLRLVGALGPWTDIADAILGTFVAAFVVPFAFSYFYVLYRAILQVKGGAVREAG